MFIENICRCLRVDDAARGNILGNVSVVTLSIVPFRILLVLQRYV